MRSARLLLSRSSVALAAVALAACGRRGPGTPASSVAELEWNFAIAHRIEVLVLHPDLVAAARVGARTLAARSGFEVELFEPGEEASGRGARLVIGTFADSLVAELADALGVAKELDLAFEDEPEDALTDGDEPAGEDEGASEERAPAPKADDEALEDGPADELGELALEDDEDPTDLDSPRALRHADRPRFAGVPLGGAGSVLAACFEDPLRPGLPVALIAGSSPASVRPLLEDLRFPRRPAARIYFAGFEQLELWLELDGEPRGSTLRDIATPRRLERRAQQSVPTGDPRFLARRSRSVEAERASEYCKAALRARDVVVSWASDATSAPPLAVAFASSAEEMLALSGRVALAVPAGLGSAGFVLLCKRTPDDGGAIVARECALALLGPPAEPWMLDGAAVDAAGSWWGRALARTDGGPARDLPPLATILDPAAIDRVSMHVLAPARGLLFRFLRERVGASALRAAWKGEAELPRGDELEREFRVWAGALEPGARAPSRPFDPPGGFLRGLAIDSRVRPGGALASSDLPHALSAAVSAGASALSFTSYGCLRAPDPFAPGGRLAWGLESIEGDAALAAAIATARSKGLRSMLLQPHLLTHEGGDYWALVPRTRREHWDEFFAGFEPWLLHYAQLAELTSCELLCIGTEILPRSSDEGADASVREHYAQLWSRAIANVRAVYGGALTYASRWPLEALAVPFWSELDAVGFTFFPELDAATRPPGATLPAAQLEAQYRIRLDLLADFAAERSLPALLVEAGFRSTRRGALEAELGPGVVDLEEQERIYEAFGNALAGARERSDALAGLFMWKWDVDPLARTGAARGFSSRDKPASTIKRDKPKNPASRAPETQSALQLIFRRD